MKIVKFKGGLGNQLFQYTFIRLLQIEFNCSDVKADFSYYDNVKNDNVRVLRLKELNVSIEEVTESNLSRILKLKRLGNPKKIIYKVILFIESTLNKKYYFESDMRYKDLSKMLNYGYYDGYWQSWKYVDSIKEILKKELAFKNALTNKTQEIISLFQSQESVFLGVRRGDYLTHAKNRELYGSFSDEYYKRAIDYIKKHTRKPVFYVFSNDIEWVKHNINFNCNVIFRDDKDVSDIEELFIMASCKHAIIVNSTYYWWGAWLIENPEKIVIAPEKWFANEKAIDIIPDTWVKM